MSMDWFVEMKKKSNTPNLLSTIFALAVYPNIYILILKWIRSSDFYKKNFPICGVYRKKISVVKLLFDIDESP